MDSTFAPELVLRDEERVNLAIIQTQPGFRVIQKIFKSAIDTFTLAMINAPEDSDEALSKHRSAKVAAQLYTIFVNRVNQEVEVYVRAPRHTDKPIDITEVLDMGAVADMAEEPWN